MRDLTRSQHDLLLVIAGDTESNGQDVKEELQQYHSTDINYGKLYPNLDMLVNRELVEKGQHERRTNYYNITDNSRQLLRERREWKSSMSIHDFERWKRFFAGSVLNGLIKLSGAGKSNQTKNE